MNQADQVKWRLVVRENLPLGKTRYASIGDRPGSGIVPGEDEVVVWPGKWLEDNIVSLDTFSKSAGPALMGVVRQSLDESSVTKIIPQKKGPYNKEPIADLLEIIRGLDGLTLNVEIKIRGG